MHFTDLRFKIFKFKDKHKHKQGWLAQNKKLTRLKDSTYYCHVSSVRVIVIHLVLWRHPYLTSRLPLFFPHFQNLDSFFLKGLSFGHPSTQPPFPPLKMCRFSYHNIVWYSTQQTTAELQYQPTTQSSEEGAERSFETLESRQWRHLDKYQLYIHIGLSSPYQLAYFTCWIKR